MYVPSCHPGTLSLSSNNIIVCVTSFCYPVPLGISVATATLCGNMLGAGDPYSAKRVALVGMIIASAVSVVYALAVLAAHDVIPKVLP